MEEQGLANQWRVQLSGHRPNLLRQTRPVLTPSLIQHLIAVLDNLVHLHIAVVFDFFATVQTNINRNRNRECERDTSEFT